MLHILHLIFKFVFQKKIRDQITTTEVNIARVYNWDVKRRQSLKTAGVPVQ